MGYVAKHLVEPPQPFRLARPDVTIPPQVEEAVMKALAKKREDRYATAPDFAREFTKSGSRTATIKEDLGRIPAPQAAVYAEPARPSRLPKIMTIAAFLLLTIGAALWFTHSNGTTTGQGVAPQTPLVVSPPPKQTPRVIEQPTATPNPPPAQAAAQQQPTRPTAHADSARKTKAALTLGDLLYKRGEYDDAIAEYRRGLDTAPSNVGLRERINRAEKAKAAEQRLNR